MIALFDLLACFASFIALGFMLNRPHGVLSHNQYTCLMLWLLVTCGIYLFSALEWLSLFVEGDVKSVGGREMEHDYVQVILPFLWTGLFLSLRKKSAGH